MNARNAGRQELLTARVRVVRTYIGTSVHRWCVSPSFAVWSTSVAFEVPLPRASITFAECTARSGALYTVHNRGDFVLTGEIYRKYQEVYGEMALGSPVSSTAVLPDGVGWSTAFEFGSIYHHPATGTRTVLRQNRDQYVALGAERSWLGYPTSDTTELSRGERNTFQSGRIDTSTDTGVAVAYQVAAPPMRSMEIKMGRDPMCIQVAGAGADALKDGAGVEMWQCAAGAKQIWDLVPVGNNAFQLKNRNSGKCLDHSLTDPEQKALSQWGCGGFVTQMWEFTNSPFGTAYALRSVYSGKVVEALGVLNASGVEVRADAAIGNQRWRLIAR